MINRGVEATLEALSGLLTTQGWCSPWLEELSLSLPMNEQWEVEVRGAAVAAAGGDDADGGYGTRSRITSSSSTSTVAGKRLMACGRALMPAG